MTDLTQREVDAGFVAARSLIESQLPGWARGMVTDDRIRALVAVIVAAVDKVRATSATAATS